MEVLPFYFVFLYICLNLQIKIIFQTLFRKFFSKTTEAKTEPSFINNKDVLEMIKNKTGVKLKKIYIQDTDLLYGYMSGFFSPKMVITTRALRLFDKNELQWLYLHEAAHFKFKHPLKIFFILFFCIVIGSIFSLGVMNLYLSILNSIFMAVIFATLAIRLLRNLEYSANKYAISKMDNPKDAISAAEKMTQTAKEKGLEKDTFIYKYFKVWNLGVYQQIIEEAKKRNV